MRTAAIIRSGRRALLSAAILFAAIASADASEPDYAGTWATDAARCKIAQDADGAPTVITGGGYDQHEAHCTFKSVTANGTANGTSYDIAAECSVEGDVQTQDFTLSVSDDTLNWAGDGGTRDLIRCK